MPPPSTARQFFGVGKKPVDEYFAPVVPSMAGRLTGNQNLDARQWLEQNRLDQIKNQYAQQQEAMQQQEFDRQQAEQQRAFQRRFQTVMGPEWENSRLREYQQKMNQQNQQAEAEQQRDSLFSALSQVDVRSDAGRKEADRLIALHPLAASDTNVSRYLSARGYDPRNKEEDRELYRRESWLGRLPTEDRLLAEEQLGKGQPLSTAQSSVVQRQKNRELQQQILNAGIDPAELPSFQDEQGNFVEERVLPRIYKQRQEVYNQQHQDPSIARALSGLRSANSALAGLKDKQLTSAVDLGEEIANATLARDTYLDQLKGFGYDGGAPRGEQNTPQQKPLIDKKAEAAKISVPYKGKIYSFPNKDAADKFKTQFQIK